MAKFSGLWAAGFKRKFSFGPDEFVNNALEGDFLSYEDALAHCGPSLYQSAEGRTLEARLSLKKTARLAGNKEKRGRLANRARHYAAALAHADSADIRILDVGGAAGIYYDILKTMPDVRFSAADIVETPEKAKAYAAANQSSFKKYYDSKESIAGKSYSHLVFGAILQVLPDPGGFIDEYLGVSGAGYLFITTFPIVDSLGKDRFMTTKKIIEGEKRSQPYIIFSRSWRDHLRGIGQVLFDVPTPGSSFVLDGKKHSYKDILIRVRKSAQ